VHVDIAPLPRAIAKRKVDLLAREVAQPVGRDQLQIDRRMALLQLGESRRP